VSLTTDGWTSRTGEPYIPLTAHYLDGKFNLNCWILAIRSFEEAHTGPNIAIKLQKILLEWGLQNVKISFTTDNARNIVAAVKSVPDWDRVPCFIHTLQLGKLFVLLY